MACPYFFPEARLEDDCWVVPPRLPLGDAYGGECRAAANAFHPDAARLRQFCNVGYGRGSCDRFPLDARADAVRFHVREDSGDLIRIQYVLEKDCWPAEHGVIECSPAAQTTRGVENTILNKQALAFAASYLRRKDLTLASGA